MRPPILTQLRALSRQDFRDLAPVTRAIDPSPKIKLSLIIPSREASPDLEKILEKAIFFLKKYFQESFEIILVPNPSPSLSLEQVQRQIEQTQACAKSFPQVRLAPHLCPPEMPGKGAALRTGILASKGEMVCFTDSDLPYDLSFFQRASVLFGQGYELITGNRRRLESRFDIPISILPFAYKRHFLGLLFNRTVRLFLPIQTTDTQAGIKVLSRRLAGQFVHKQRCPGFFFDLEIFLLCETLGYSHAEIPVSLDLHSEKSTVRVFRESILAFYWLFRIWQGQLNGYYGIRKRKPLVLNRYYSVDSLSLGTKFFLLLRWLLTPYSSMAKELPPQGRILDYGCGHGLFGLTLAQSSSSREVLGIDHDTARIKAASEAGKGLANLKFQTGSLFEPLTAISQSVKGISLIDVMHYFEPEAQRSNIARAYESLDSKGVLIFREVDPNAGVISRLNQFYEKVATSIGFTRSNEKSLYFRSKEDWLQLLKEAGFKCRARRCSSILFADVLYIGEKP
jgi:glycosyltransferase involved in cell wall biosynthesis